MDNIEGQGEFMIDLNQSLLEEQAHLDLNEKVLDNVI